MSKVLFKEYNVHTPKGFTISDKNLSSGIIAEKINDELSYPCVIKPNDQGSTVGLTVCKNENDVDKALKLAFNFSDKVLIEEFIAGREMTVAVIEDKALPVLEIKPKHGLYDYECKYTSGMSEYEVPAKIPDLVAAELQSQALLAFKALDCSSYARVDFRLSENNKPYCLEVNSLPGMTSTSLVPKMAKAIGISFDQLVERIINISF
jgi:D-alanine-D-alanine ligase